MEQLTPRQLDCLRRAAFTNRQIANQLNISVQGVKNHLTVAYSRLDINTPPLGVHDLEGQKRLRALIRALKLGYLSLDEVILPTTRHYGVEVDL